MLNILYGTILIILSTLSISLLAYLIYCLAIYFYKVTPFLIRLFKEYRKLKKSEKGFVKYYRNGFK
ncbi:hypothetical protein ACQPUY_10410 [Clostridium nigeriense]|uniref:hypothetical protein n=1 Tax=Clostridium nigeriense TaxID=1805470 RepID=UPI003D32CB82